MRSRNFQGFLLLMMLTGGRALPMLILIVGLAISFALQGAAFALIAAPFVFLTSLLIFAAVTTYRRAPIATLAGVAAVVGIAIVVCLQHGLGGLIHDAVRYPPFETFKWIGGGIVCTVWGALNYIRFDREARAWRARIAYFATMMTFWLAVFGSAITMVQWHQHLHPTATHTVHAKTTASVIHE